MSDGSKLQLWREVEEWIEHCKLQIYNKEKGLPLRILQNLFLDYKGPIVSHGQNVKVFLQKQLQTKYNCQFHDWRCTLECGKIYPWTKLWKYYEISNLCFAAESAYADQNCWLLDRKLDRNEDKSQQQQLHQQSIHESM